MFTLPCLFTSVTMGVLAQLLIKRGLNRLGALDFASGVVSAYVRMLLTPTIVLGIVLYVVAVLFWLYALSKVDLSFAFPFYSGTSYILVALLSWGVLGESISMLRLAGMAVICFGVFLISRG